jgi:hypothetical protein
MEAGTVWGWGVSWKSIYSFLGLLDLGLPWRWN